MATTWPLVGRASAVERVLQAFGQDDGVVIRGPAGVGKTRLLDECFRAASAVPAVRIVASSGLSHVPLGALAPASGIAIGPAAFDAFVETVEQSRLPRPLVVVDDIHWLDSESIGLLHQLVVAKTIRLVATMRSGQSRSVALEQLWASTRLAFVDIGPLPPRDAATLLETALGGAFEPGTEATLLDASAGNVLYLRELVDGSIASGVLAAEDGVWRLRGPMVGTPQLEEIIAARHADASGEELEALEVLALSGRVPLELIEQLVEARTIEGLERKHLVTIDEPAPGNRRPGALTVDLVHPVHGEVLRRRMPSLARIRLSRRLVDVAAAIDEPTPEVELRLGAWMRIAGGPGDAALLDRLARRALDAGDTELAAELGRQAVDAGAPFATAVMTAFSFTDFADHDAAAAVLDKGRAQLAGPDPAAEAAFASCRAQIMWWWRRDLAGAYELLEEALAQHPSIALPEAELAMFDLLRGRVRQAIDRMLPLVDHPETSTASTAMAVVGIGGSYTNETGRALPVAEAGFARSLARADGLLPPNPGLHLVGQIMGMAHDGQIDRAAGLASVVRDAAARQPSRQARAWAAICEGEVATLAGRHGDAVRAWREAERVWRDLGVQGMQRWCLIGCATTAAEQRDVATLRAAVDACDELHAEGFELHESRLLGARAWVQHLTGQPDATTLVAEAFELALEQGAEYSAGAVLHALAQWDQPDLDALSRRDWSGGLLRAWADHARAVDARDATLLDEAATVFAGLGANGFAAEASDQAALWHERAGRAAAAQRSRARRTELGVATAGPAPVPDPVGSLTSALSPREFAVARLAALGLSNREIAAELVLSERTVENHLYRTFTKLAITRRGELASRFPPEP